MADQNYEIEELNLDEMDEVSGGIFPALVFGGYAALGALITIINGGVAAGKVVELVDDLDEASDRPPISSGGGFGSDIRLKQAVSHEGRISSLDVDVYSWEYKQFPGERFVGVMAQDLLARKDLSHAVFTFKEGAFKGFYGVDYAALGLRCLPEEAFDGVASLLAQEVKPVSA